MDVTMPGLDGFEATAQISRAYPDIRIIGLSMHNDADTRQKMLNAGASAYLTKTGSPDALIGTIRRLHHG
jgi:DNA-binding NarL/FixJ family response regulator